MNVRARFAVLVLLLVGTAAAAQGGGAGGGGGGGGGGGSGKQRAAAAQDPKCGSDLVVVAPDGQKRRYESVQEFLAGFQTVNIDLGERERPAVPVDVVLKSFGADWVDALDCNNQSRQLPSGLPFEGGREYLVFTGRKGLKAVREMRPGSYNNTVQQIRKLTLHASNGHSTPPQKKKG